MFLRWNDRSAVRSVSVAIRPGLTEPEGHFRSFFAVSTQKYGLARQSLKEEKNENTILLYHDENGKTDVSVRFADEDVWVTQVQLAELYDTTRQNIGQHIENIYKDEELPRDATIKKFFIVQQEGKREVRRELDHYNLDVIIAIGYRVQSPVATRFRRWATARLHEYIQKGFALDDERLKNGRNRRTHIRTRWQRQALCRNDKLQGKLHHRRRCENRQELLVRKGTVEIDENSLETRALNPEGNAAAHETAVARTQFRVDAHVREQEFQADRRQLDWG